MKKRTKISLRTKIYLALVGLLALTGILYASNPVPFTAAVPFPTGVAASPDLFLVSEYCSEKIDKVDCNGNATTFATMPGFGSCREKYMAVVPTTSIASGFIPRDVYVTEGALVFRVDQGTGAVSLFASLPGCLASDHNGITFDHFGTYGFDMIVTCREGNVFRANGLGTVTQIATIYPPNSSNTAEGPAVVSPLLGGPHAGEIWIADEVGNAVHTVGLPPTYTVTNNFLSHPTAEGLYAIPDPLCTYCGSFSFGLAEQQQFQFVWLYPQSDFVGLGGKVILTSESNGDNADTVVVSWDGFQYVKTSFAPRVPGVNEGASFVDCGVPTATPTSTPTATFTPSATFTPTPTATFTPTPTATFTPTPTATFTPTPTATFTPTPTPTTTASPTPCALGSCTPPYPFASSNPRTNIAFNESEVLRAFRLTGVTEDCIPRTLQLFYNDEHALTLGVRQINEITCLGTTTTNYPVSPMVVHPADGKLNPMTGATEAQGGIDTSGRPMFPALFLTDVTFDPNSLAGDWQFGGTGIPPDAVYGTWKAAVRTIDKTKTPNTVTVTPDADPASNNWNLDGSPDAVPTPTPANEGYGAECRWDLTNPALGLTPGHRYRAYFMVHDGDQNKTGGDSGQACVFFNVPGPAPTASPTPTSTPTPTPTATPGLIVAGGKTYGGSGGASKTVTVSFLNQTSSNQELTGLSMTWPQATNGNLKTIKMGGTTIFNTSTGGGSVTIPPGLLGTTAQRTIAAGSCATLTFTFTNNVSTNPANYTGSATFNPFGPVTMFP